MTETEEKEILDILYSELVPALGCTEPIAIAYASAKARQILGTEPSHIDICCSGNIIKNVKGVLVPNSGGMKGVGAAAVLGVVGGNADLGLEVLSEVNESHIAKAKELLSGSFFSCRLQKNVANLYIVATVSGGAHSASVTIINRHTAITEMKKDGEVIYQLSRHADGQEDQTKKKPWTLTMAGILDFAKNVSLEEVRPLLESQIELNSAIAREGLSRDFGAQVGRTILQCYPDDVRTRARAYAAAGSDARMSGCSMPVVINSGSGNQGMTVSLPVLEYAREWKVPEEMLYRALLISNLTAIHLKHYIGSLSAFCGAVSAACAAGCAITYMAGGSDMQICNTIINTLANVGGIVCDGAKASCAAKIASAVDAAILGYHMSMNGHCFQAGDGIIQDDIEQTIRSIGYVGRVGMKETDEEILNIMMDHVDFHEETE
ncbi:MAG: L-serine ammonia-lyase, iron-sulfur-dependent, subunit alpha [Firmicutes bacterium]|nr:L-serine ammonia-lyase, iron-sulfur-dependent, subunit alpha [Bacillota bacterium]MDY5856921.1 L-serine ammonia-lyase, iron-sulfur-dependent, subunit alpha [Anaerovoracaceae bacterium]